MRTVTLRLKREPTKSGSSLGCLMPHSHTIVSCYQHVVVRTLIMDLCTVLYLVSQHYWSETFQAFEAWHLKAMVCDLVIQASFGVAASFAATTATTATATTATATAATAAAVTAPVWLPAACAVAGVATAAAVAKMMVDYSCDPPRSQLGVGAFGEVTLHKEGGKSWALKRISHAVLQHRQLQGAAATERRALEMSQCSFVVQYFGHVACNHDTVLVMELLDDLTKTYTTRQLWGNEQKVRLDVACIASALQHIHQQKVYHRDVKPGNLLLDALGRCKLCDFGCAKIGGGRAYSFVGTAEYMAPEVIERKGHDSSVDWWGLGCVIYELLSGNRMFKGKRDHVFSAILQGVGAAEMETIEACPSAADLITKLCTVPQERIDSMEVIRAHSWYCDQVDFHWPVAHSAMLGRRTNQSADFMSFL